MAAFGYQNTDVNVRFTGTSVTIPNNGFARLMYYLSCVDGCVPDVIPAQFKNYRDYYMLSHNQKSQLVSVVRHLKPELLNDVIFFRVEGMESGNEFVEISVAQRTISGLATSRGVIAIGGRNVNVSKIMLYRSDWMRKNYWEALESASNELSCSCCTIL